MSEKRDRDPIETMLALHARGLISDDQLAKIKTKHDPTEWQRREEIERAWEQHRRQSR